MSVDALQLTQIPTVHVGMLVHKPPSEAFQAFVDPAITTKFWFTRSSDKMTPGAELRWDWEMYGVSTKVAVKEVEANHRIRFEWGDDKPTTVELRFTPWGTAPPTSRPPRPASAVMAMRSWPASPTPPAASPSSCAP
jgi:uncharacterized protein YndB with AHSA1/START domain